MRKELVIAIILGVTFSLVIGYGVRIARHSLANRPSPSPQERLTQQESTTRSDHTILITSPEADEITPSSPLKVIGTTTPLSMVSARSGDAYATSVADDTGAFTLEFAVQPGPNAIVLDSFHPEGDLASVSFTAVVSSADLSATSSAKPSPSPRSTTND